jgi:DnaJ-class molecular chaperone
MDLKKANSKQCPVCNGSGKIVAGYGVVCTELVEKMEKCHACKGKGFLKLSGSLEEQAMHLKN